MSNFKTDPVKAFLQPDPEEWFDSARLKILEEDLSAASDTLAIAGLLPSVLNHWLRQQLALDAPWSLEDRKQAIEERQEEWLKKVNTRLLGLREHEIALKLAVSPGSEAWARNQWEHRLETLFLKCKDKLDRASCRILLVSDKGLALELYHRIKAGEADFDSVARRFSNGAERTQGGLITLRPLASMPLGLGKVLPRLDLGELLPPCKLGENFAVVQLEDWQPARFDDHSKRSLLSMELDNWLQVAGDLAMNHLRYL